MLVGINSCLVLKELGTIAPIEFTLANSKICFFIMF